MRDRNRPGVDDFRRWIGSAEIEAIDGALKTSACVVRACKQTLADGKPPSWARKADKGR